MSNQFIVKLKFTSPLHLARGRSDYSQSEKVLHSDALKSALFVTWQLLHGEGQADAEAFFEGFRISSAFPFWNDHLFFPRPAADLMPFFKQNADVPFKDAKKVQYLEKSALLDFVYGRKGLWDESMLAASKSIVIRHKFKDDKERQQFKLMHTEILQHVAVPRYVDYSKGEEVDADGETFYMERLRFTEGAGLFFIVQFDDAQVEAHFKHALHLLSDEGLGSDRNTGNGQFESPTFEPFQLDLPDNGSHAMNLSLFCPSEKDFNDGKLMDGASYSLIKRGGFVSSAENSEHTTLLKCPVYMFQEGSLFAVKELEGKNIDLKPSAMSGHPVWREGRPLTLPVILG